jgi:hypothetical protein
MIAPLIPAKDLLAWAPLTEAAIRARNYVEVAPDARAALAHFVFFDDEAIRSKTPFASLAPVEVFYNAYYWFSVFSQRQQAQTGYDAGLEDMLSKMLESAPDGVDWRVVEAIHDQAKTVS